MILTKNNDDGDGDSARNNESLKRKECPSRMLASNEEVEERMENENELPNPSSLLHLRLLAI